MRFDNLNDWLNWQESFNPKEIDLGLNRVAQVLAKAGLSSSFNCPLITVAGTNGKGSVVAMLEAIAMAAGLKVCSYTSPHIFKYNERIKINGLPAAADVLCESFDRIDRARGDSPLTYFEFGTLAAIDIFFSESPDLVILEVGLGGRLDAVNVMDSDVSVLTSIAIDHIDWLGENRESIGFEKAGIFRAKKPVICGEPQPPSSVCAAAEKLQCEFIQLGIDYKVINNEKLNDVWALQSCYQDIADLAQPSLQGEFQKSNAATAIMALQALQAKGFFDSLTGAAKSNYFTAAIKNGLSCINLPGRFQKINTKPSVYVDVAHNPHAAQALAMQLKATGLSKKQHTWAIVAMLADKDIKGVLGCVSAEIDCWCFSGLEDVSRGLSVQAFIKRIPADINAQAGVLNCLAKDELQDKSVSNQCTILADAVLRAETVEKACELVLSKANENDRVIIFGSFYTVTKAMQFFLNEEAVEFID